MTQHPTPQVIHAGFYCRDVEASAAWYREVLGMNPQFGRAMERGSAIGKAAEHGYGRGFYVRDPDGNLVELWAYKQDGDEEKVAPLTERHVNDEPRGGGFALDAMATYEKWKAHRAAKVDA